MQPSLKGRLSRSCCSCRLVAKAASQQGATLQVREICRLMSGLALHPLDADLQQHQASRVASHVHLKLGLQLQLLLAEGGPEPLFALLDEAGLHFILPEALLLQLVQQGRVLLLGLMPLHSTQLGIELCLEEPDTWWLWDSQARLSCAPQAARPQAPHHLCTGTRSLACKAALSTLVTRSPGARTQQSPPLPVRGLWTGRPCPAAAWPLQSPGPQSCAAWAPAPQPAHAAAQPHGESAADTATPYAHSGSTRSACGAGSGRLRSSLLGPAQGV